MADAKYICIANCPELDYGNEPHCKSNTICDEYFQEYGCCRVGNVPIWKELNYGTQTADYKKLCEDLRHILPEKVDYADLVCAESFAYGFHYVYPDEEGYIIEGAINAIEELQAENERVKKQLEWAVEEIPHDCEHCKHNFFCGSDCGGKRWQWLGEEKKV